MSWVRARVGSEGGRARLTIEHFSHPVEEGPGAEFFATYGPAAGAWAGISDSRAFACTWPASTRRWSRRRPRRG